MKLYFVALSKYVDFRGRSNRREYWIFILVSNLVTLALSYADMNTGIITPVYGIGLLSSLYLLGILIPATAVSVRRLHDTNHSGWWLLILLIPLVGIMMHFIFMLTKGDPAENNYGSYRNKSCSEQ